MTVSRHCVVASGLPLNHEEMGMMASVEAYEG
jgi:hypothetical protein